MTLWKGMSEMDIISFRELGLNSIADTLRNSFFY